MQISVHRPVQFRTRVFTNKGVQEKTRKEVEAMTIAIISRFSDRIVYWYNVKEVLDNGTVIFEDGTIDYIDDWFNTWKKVQ